MKIRILAFATLLAAGFVGVDGVAENVGVDGALTGNAAAVCMEDPVTGGCLPLCPPNPVPPNDKLPVGVEYHCLM